MKYPWGTVTHSCDSGSSPAFFLVFWPLLCALPPCPVGDSKSPLLRSPKVRKELVQMLPEVEVPGTCSEHWFVWGYAQTHCQGGSVKLQHHLVVEAGLAGTGAVTLGSHSRRLTPGDIFGGRAESSSA